MHAPIEASAPNRERDAHFERCLDLLTNYLGGLPLSCSLFQSVMGILAEGSLLSDLDPHYVAIVTNEAEQFFPGLATLSRRFEFDHT